MPFAMDSSPCASEEAPEVTVHLRTRGINTPTQMRNTNRHSYHGTPTAIHSTQAYYQPVNRFSHVYLPLAPSLSNPQRQANDWEQLRCAKKRLSANFGVTLSSLSEDMNPNDINNRPFVDTLQQGSDLQESPRGSSVASGPTLKRDEGSQPHLVPQGGMPVQGHILVDPATGQHYIIPQTAFYQPMPAMQSMFYPPPQPQPMYYPYGQHIPQGYMMPPGAQSQQGHFAMQIQANPQQFASQAGSRGFPSPMTFRHTFIPPVHSSTEDLSRQNSLTEEHNPPQSPVQSMGHPYPPPPMFPQAQTSFVQQYRQNHPAHGSASNLRSSPNSQPEDPESGRDSFRRDLTRSSAEFATRSSGEFSRKGSAEFKPKLDGQLINRTPLYGGPPQWWGREEAAESLTDVESRRERVSPPVQIQTTTSDTEANRGPPRVPPAPRPVRMDIDFNSMPEKEKQIPAKPSVRSLRMDIDISKPMPEEEELLKKKATPRAPATAFTVDFNTPKGGVSLQDAALKSAQVRRVLGRRSGGSGSSTPPQCEKPSTPAGPPIVEAANKKFLLSKLLHGASEEETTADVPDIEERKDGDVISEAGTFVVDISKRNTSGQNDHMQRVVENSDDSTDSDSDSDSTADGRSDPRGAVTPRQSIQQPPSPKRAAPAPAKPDNILQELVKLRQMAGLPGKPNTTPAAAPVVSIRSSRQQEPARPATMQSLPPLTKKSSGPHLQQQAPASNRSVFGPSSRPPSAASTTNAFRRGDGGRFSMRGPGAQDGLTSPQQVQKRPPFRAGGAPTRSVAGTVNQQQEQMTAWLRRKDYNPMKAAAEAKKNKELKASTTDLSIVSVESETLREDQFMSNRSVSFHVGPAAAPKNTEYGQLSRNRSQESVVENEAEQASQRIVAEYSRGMVKDINRLTQKNASATRQQHSGLARAVDLLSQKCKKSIELIRSQNKGCLSVSVEDLLAAAAEPPRVHESLNEQLERLSDAFDAVQRYLEQYSLDGHQSPIPEFNEDPEDMHSLASGFSGFSFRSHQIPQERMIRSPIAASVTNGSPRTSGYRSRVLTGNNFMDTSPHSPR